MRAVRRMMHWQLCVARVKGREGGCPQASPGDAATLRFRTDEVFWLGFGFLAQNATTPLWEFAQVHSFPLCEGGGVCEGDSFLSLLLLQADCLRSTTLLRNVFKFCPAADVF